jgi:hypothetical protein
VQVFVVDPEAGPSLRPGELGEGLETIARRVQTEEETEIAAALQLAAAGRKFAAGRSLWAKCLRCGERAKITLGRRDFDDIERAKQDMVCNRCGARGCDASIEFANDESVFSPAPAQRHVGELPSSPFALGALLAVQGLIAASAAFAVIVALLFVGAVINKGTQIVFHALDYEISDNIRNSPAGGYYDRNE